MRVPTRGSIGALPALPYTRGVTLSHHRPTTPTASRDFHSSRHFLLFTRRPRMLNNACGSKIPNEMPSQPSTRFLRGLLGGKCLSYTREVSPTFTVTPMSTIFEHRFRHFPPVCLQSHSSSISSFAELRFSRSHCSILRMRGRNDVLSSCSGLRPLNKWPPSNTCQIQCCVCVNR